MRKLNAAVLVLSLLNSSLVLAAYEPRFNCKTFLENINKVQVVEDYLKGTSIHETSRTNWELNEKIVADLDLDALSQLLGQSLFTSSGRKRLDWMLRNPRLKSDEIREVQETVKELAQNTELASSLRALFQEIKVYEARTKAWELFIERLAAKLRISFKFGKRSLNDGINTFKEERDLAFILSEGAFCLLFFAFPLLEAHMAMTARLPELERLLAAKSIVLGPNIIYQGFKRSNLGKLKKLSVLAANVKQQLKNVKSPYLNELNLILTALEDPKSDLDFSQADRTIKRLTTNWFGSRFLDSLMIGNLTLLHGTSLAHKEVHKFALMASVISELDMLLGFAALATKPDQFKFPKILDETSPVQIVMNQALNPVLLLSQKPVVANSAHLTNTLEPDTTQIAFVTGPQARGKSTYIRTVALNTILAQVGAPVPAEDFVITPMAIVSTIKNTDSTVNDESRFRAEARRVKAIIEKVNQNPRSLVLLDEVFSGTSNEEKIALEESLMRYLQKRGCLVMASSHSRGLVHLEGQIPGFKNFHASDSDERKFIIEPGPSKFRNAFKILKEEGIPDELIEDAYSTYKGPNELLH